jgi:hypothetical protein
MLALQQERIKRTTMQKLSLPMVMASNPRDGAPILDPIEGDCSDQYFASPTSPTLMPFAINNSEDKTPQAQHEGSMRESREIQR